MAKFLVTYRETVGGEWEALLEADAFVLDGDWFLFGSPDVNEAWVRAHDVRSIVRQEPDVEELDD